MRNVAARYPGFISPRMGRVINLEQQNQSLRDARIKNQRCILKYNTEDLSLIDGVYFGIREKARHRAWLASFNGAAGEQFLARGQSLLPRRRAGNSIYRGQTVDEKHAVKGARRTISQGKGQTVFPIYRDRVARAMGSAHRSVARVCKKRRSTRPSRIHFAHGSQRNTSGARAVRKLRQRRWLMVKRRPCDARV